MASHRWLIAGLGNPGRDYSHNRHNVGYWTVNRLARLHGIGLKATRLAALGEGEIAGERVVLLKPRAFVNRSGQAVAAAMKHFSATLDRLLVVYDELDLPVGRLRIRASGGAGGHNGLRSIIQSAGSGDFARIRIGIGRPHAGGKPSWDPEDVARWVLSDPAPEEAKALQDAVKRAAQAIEMILAEGLQAAMNRYNK
jgi:PTH1 family peptidyl-tRNA hydrolase